MIRNDRNKSYESVDTLRERERERERESKFIDKGENRKSRILKLKLSATMGVMGVIVFIIIAIVTVKIISEKVNSKADETLAGDDTPGYSLVDSTEIGEDGKPIQVPVPDGFTASQVPGETTVNGGFVIYEGEVDWSKIGDLDSYAEIDRQAEKEDTSTESYNSAENTDSELIDVEDISEESSNSDAENNTDSAVTNNSDENGVTIEQAEESANVVEQEQKENVTNEEHTQEECVNEIVENATNEAQESQEEKIEEKETNDNGEEEQGNNDLTIEEKSISNEEAGIATLAEGEEPTTVFELQTSVNQYVWVPVKDISRIYGIDSNGKLWGKLYYCVSTSGSTSSRFPLWSENNGVMESQKSVNYREPDVIPTQADYDIDSNLQRYKGGIERYQMLSKEMEESFYKMIKSIKKYGGFYIGRYETGDMNQEKAVVEKMNSNLKGSGINWYVMYEKCQGLAGKKENIETSMIWGSLWDETLQWLLESEAQITYEEYITNETGEEEKIMITKTIEEEDINDDSVNWGNYANAKFEYTNKDGGTSIKRVGVYTQIPTGSAERTKANNIYDMAGNVKDCTLETNSTDRRVGRGGDRYDQSFVTRARNRNSYESTKDIFYYDDYGCRAMLYIK